jgi:phosphatidylethanolamine-binding protein (PEBP) family uncharacterized protein
MRVFINDIKLNHKSIYPLKLFESNKLEIKSMIDPTKIYTIMILDEDAPSKSNPINKYMIHLLIINNKTTIFDYNTPNPPANSGLHRYYVLIYEQTNQIDKSNITINSRPKFDLDNFVSKHKLNLFDKFMFLTERK